MNIVKEIKQRKAKKWERQDRVGREEMRERELSSSACICLSLTCGNIWFLECHSILGSLQRHGHHCHDQTFRGGRERKGWVRERERWREKVVVRVSDVETVKKRWSVKTMIDYLPRTWHHRCWEHIAKLTGNAHSSEHLTELIVRSDLSIPYSSSETSISQTDWKVSYSAAVTLMCVLCVIWVESF